MSLPDDKRAAAAQGMLHAWWAARIPDRLALITPHGDRTYDDLNARSTGSPARCGPAACRQGDAIALMCTNEPEFLEALYAAQRIGLRLTPINWHLTGEEAAYIIENCEAKAFVCSGSLGDRGRRGRGRRRAGPGEDQHRRLPPRLRDVQHGRGRRGRDRHRRPGHRHADALHVGHDRPAQGRAPPERRRERAGHRQLLRLRRGLRDQHRRPPPDRPAVPRRAAGLLGGGPVSRTACRSW